VWSADAPTYLRLNNATPITGRRFRFTLLDADGMSLVLNGPTYLTLLVRGAAGLGRV
jgi:hypothetical protein